MKSQGISVRSAAGAYTVLCAPGLMKQAAGKIGALGEFTGVYLLTSPRVARHLRVPIEKYLRDVSLRATILFNDREEAKNLDTVERISRHLVRAGADRRALLIAVGGGVVGDVSGFVAASYLRGVALVHVPTTLVAQVDSAIGGKTGVNLPEGKNLVGAFYSPRLVLADPSTLATLPNREYRSGLYEVVKYGVITNVPLFNYLEQNLEKVIARDAAALAYVIPACIADKARVVSRDERESGLREILNFGHTFAHALETATAYRVYRHGEAVGWGMIAAARLAARLGMFPVEQGLRVEELVRRVGPLPPMPRTAAARLVEIMGADKKTRGGKLRFVLPRRIGKVETISDVPGDVVLAVLNELRAERSPKR
jgi:3-dehydroquinate synthase